MQWLRACIASLTCRAPKQECDYCNEHKRPRAFQPTRLLPGCCYAHLRAVCKVCIQTALAVQLSTKPLFEVGCPQCGLTWSRRHVLTLLSARDKKRYRRIDDHARGRSCVPDELPEMQSLDLLLRQGARFCPFCKFPFVKDGGCDYMSCTKCGKGFEISYALVLDDGNGRRAANVPVELDI